MFLAPVTGDRTGVVPTLTERSDFAMTATARPEPGSRYDATLRAIAEFAASTRYQDVGEEAIRATLRCHIDAVGCAAGGFDSDPCRIARALCQQYPVTEGMSAFGVPAKVLPDYAVFSNASHIRQLDFNDVYSGRVVGGGHPSDMVAAIFGAAELRGGTGKDVIVGLYTAYEVFGAIADSYPIRGRGFDQGANLAVATAAGLGRVLELSSVKIMNAISLALTAGLPLRVVRAGELSHWKGCAAAHATMVATFVTRLAQAGMTGPPAVFTGTDGFHRHVAADVPPALAFRGNPREPSKIENTQMKFFPAEQSTQGPIALALSLRPDIFSVDEIESITVSTYHLAWHEIGGGQGDAAEKWDPHTRESADHSLPYVIAAALFDGELTLDTFAPERIADPALRPLMAKVEVVVDDALTQAYEHEHKLPAVLKIRLRSGRTLSASVDHPRGMPQNALTDEELCLKFMKMATQVMPQADAEHLLDTLWQLEQMEDLSRLADGFRQWRVV
jgi:2-methylcitrate dehydratase